MNLLHFTVIGDPAFDLFFSIPASISVILYLAFAFTSVFRGRV